MKNIKKYTEQLKNVENEVRKVVFGKDEVIEKVLMAIIGSGHILIDDIPGVGKTTLSYAFSRAMSLEQKKVQFTPDILPSDITGFSVYDKETGRFSYRYGAVMCNLFLADEINRTSPKTQSALLEVMEEGVVTVDGVTRNLPDPFIVLATQNPVGSIGTQKLPESQLDRFMICVRMGYPSFEAETQVIQGKRYNLMETVKPVMTADDLMEIREAVKQVYIEKSVCEYIAHIAEKTRENEYISLGLSPRGSVAVAGMAKACAFLCERDYVTPSDVQKILYETTIHRLILCSKAKINNVAVQDILKDILKSVKVPELIIRQYGE
ncbi:MAG: AAA family ATPase [Lachnospira sp.]